MKKSLEHVTPLFTATDAADYCSADAKALGNVALRSGCGTNGPNVGLSELSAAAVLSNGHDVAPLGVPVGCVGGAVAEPQVVLVTAGRVVAFMEDAQASWDGAVLLNPRQAVGEPLFTLPMEPAVSVFVPIPRPGPTGIRAAALVGVMVKALRKRPVPRGVESFIEFGSHSLALLWRLMVRAGTVLRTRFRPAFSTKFGCAAEGASPWR